MQKEVQCKGGWGALWKRDITPKESLQELKGCSQEGT